MAYPPPNVSGPTFKKDQNMRPNHPIDRFADLFTVFHAPFIDFLFTLYHYGINFSMASMEITCFAHILLIYYVNLRNIYTFISF